MLTLKEKDQIRKVIAYKCRTKEAYDLMKSFAGMTDDEVRTAIAEWKTERLTQKQGAQGIMDEIDKEIA